MSHLHIIKLKRCYPFFQLSIFQSIEENDLEFLTALLTDEQFITKIDLNHVYEEQKGQTLLHTAIENENLEAVRLLVSSGASCTQFNKANHTSLHVAARKGLVNIYFSSNKLSGFLKANLLTKNQHTHSKETMVICEFNW